MRYKYTNSGTRNENAQRWNFSCVIEAVMAEVKGET